MEHRESYEKPRLQRHENLKTITLVSTVKLEQDHFAEDIRDEL